MNKNIIDELIAMAEQLGCVSPMPTEATMRAQIERGLRATDPEFKYLRCPHCKMLDTLRQLKLEQRQQERT
jgi:hypothetical protein